MNDTPGEGRAVPIPVGRLSRISRLGAMTAGVAGNMAMNGLSQLGQGKRPVMRDLLLTPSNLSRVAEQLAQMRGAAMKIGQLVSMDSGDVLPPELSDIMARLRNDAHFMPPAQLKQVLNTSWRDGWARDFKRFDPRPIAAASIGQVHRAQTRDGRDMAIKVQYPGVAQSIDNDVANVGVLIRASGLLPKGFELAPYLEEARAQLHEETDYDREAEHMTQFAHRLAADPRFLVPTYYPDRSSAVILAMSFVQGHPIEDCTQLSQSERDDIAKDLIGLSLRELFEFGTMQSDPNFANYRYDPASKRIVLLDFGATRDIAPLIVDQYGRFLAAGVSRDYTLVNDIACEIGFLPKDCAPEHAERIKKMLKMCFDELAVNDVYDFSDTRLSRAMQEEGMALAQDGFVPQPMPMDVLYVQRKLAGMFLLAARLRAKVDLQALLKQALMNFSAAKAAY